MTEIAPRGFTGADVPDAAIYDTCIRCGLCLQSCPTYLETSVETSSPRGRISLIRAVGEGTLDLLSPGFVAQMSECLDCRGCEAVCPSGVLYGRLIEPARAQIRRAQREREGLLRRVGRYVTLRLLFKHLGLMRALAALLRFAQATHADSIASLFGLGSQAALAPRLVGTPFVPTGQRFATPDAQGVAFLHTGCIMHVAFAATHEATIRMLRRGRLSVVVPRAQGCCGAIAVHAGEAELGREMARKNIEAFERSGADVYVVNAAGCGSMLKEYPQLFEEADPWHDRAKRFSSRVRDVLEVLDAVDLPTPQRFRNAVVAYQDACHLANAQRVSAAPRRLLATIPGLQLVEMKESTICCGSAGIYNLTQPEMAQRLGARKAAAIVETGAEIVATANPGCALQIAAALRAAHCAAPVVHVVDLLDGAYASEGIVG
ncbi:MAG: (Fe-S)-binding protein [Candidatus Tyrphobacter sp.]